MTGDRERGRPWHDLLLLIGAGLIIRLLWIHQGYGSVAAFAEGGEATRVALAIAEQGRFADAFFPGQGATAHLLPTMPVIAGSVFAALGPGSAAANIALAAWSLAQSFTAYLLLRALFRSMGADPATLRGALILLCLVPVFLPQEAVDFRYWEGALALCLVALNFLLLVRLEATGNVGWRDLATVAALSAATFFVSPPAGLAVDACWAAFALCRLTAARVLAMAGMSAAALALVMAPWALRNLGAVGAPVLRSNFGLELALAYHPNARAEIPAADRFRARLRQIHPYHGTDAQAALKAAGGEVSYARRLGEAGREWMAANPGDAALLTGLHLLQFFFPQPWQMQFSDWNAVRAPRAIVITIVNLIGLVALAIGAMAGWRGYRMLAIYVAVVALPYALVQPVPRYTFLVYGVLAFAGADLLSRAYRRLSRGRMAPEPRDRRVGAPRDDHGRPCRGSARRTG